MVGTTDFKWTSFTPGNIITIVVIVGTALTAYITTQNRSNANELAISQLKTNDRVIEAKLESLITVIHQQSLENAKTLTGMKSDLKYLRQYLRDIRREPKE